MVEKEGEGRMTCELKIRQPITDLVCISREGKAPIQSAALNTIGNPVYNVELRLQQRELSRLICTVLNYSDQPCS